MTQNKVRTRKGRADRVRRKVRGTASRPRFSVFRSLRYIYVQLIDDEHGTSLGGISTRSPRFKEKHKGSADTVEAARILGTMAGELARARGVKEIVFDRGGYRYHGRIRALADAARKAGLQF